MPRVQREKPNFIRSGATKSIENCNPMKISHTASSINVGCFEIMSVYDVFDSFYKFSLPNLFKDLLDSFGIYLETQCRSLELFLIF